MTQNVSIFVGQNMESWILYFVRISLALAQLYIVLTLVEILRIYAKMKFPLIFKNIIWLSVAYTFTMTYIIADLFDHLNSVITWRMPFVLISVLLGLIAVRNLRNYFRSAEIGD